MKWLMYLGLAYLGWTLSRPKGSGQTASGQPVSPTQGQVIEYQDGSTLVWVGDGTVLHQSADGKQSGAATMTYAAFLAQAKSPGAQMIG